MYKILLVEDDRNTLEGLANILEQEGYENDHAHRQERVGLVRFDDIGLDHAVDLVVHPACFGSP